MHLKTFLSQSKVIEKKSFLKTYKLQKGLRLNKNEGAASIEKLFHFFTPLLKEAFEQSEMLFGVSKNNIANAIFNKDFDMPSVNVNDTSLSQLINTLNPNCEIDRYFSFFQYFEERLFINKKLSSELIFAVQMLFSLFDFFDIAKQFFLKNNKPAFPKLCFIFSRNKLATGNFNLDAKKQFKKKAILAFKKVVPELITQEKFKHFVEQLTETAFSFEEILDFYDLLIVSNTPYNHYSLMMDYFKQVHFFQNLYKIKKQDEFKTIDEYYYFSSFILYGQALGVKNPFDLSLYKPNSFYLSFESNSAFSKSSFKDKLYLCLFINYAYEKDKRNTLVVKLNKYKHLLDFLQLILEQGDGKQKKHLTYTDFLNQHSTLLKKDPCFFNQALNELKFCLENEDDFLVLLHLLEIIISLNAIMSNELLIDHQSFSYSLLSIYTLFFIFCHLSFFTKEKVNLESINSSNHRYYFLNLLFDFVLNNLFQNFNNSFEFLPSDFELFQNERAEFFKLAKMEERLGYNFDYFFYFDPQSDFKFKGKSVIYTLLKATVLEDEHQLKKIISRLPNKQFFCDTLFPLFNQEARLISVKKEVNSLSSSLLDNDFLNNREVEIFSKEDKQAFINGMSKKLDVKFYPFLLFSFLFGSVFLYRKQSSATLFIEKPFEILVRYDYEWFLFFQSPRFNNLSLKLFEPELTGSEKYFCSNEKKNEFLAIRSGDTL